MTTHKAYHMQFITLYLNVVHNLDVL